MRDERPSLTPAFARLADVMGAYRYEVTDFEAECWRAIIDRVPEALFLSFLSHHYQTSNFPPKPSDATKFLDRSINPEAAFLGLQHAVRELGPYRAPTNLDPILVQTIYLMGGWAVVNEQMPASSETHAMRTFKERFDNCFSAAVAHVRIQALAPSGELTSLLGASRGESMALARPTEKN